MFIRSCAADLPIGITGCRHPRQTGDIIVDLQHYCRGGPKMSHVALNNITHD
jgi:hypothetical protein